MYNKILIIIITSLFTFPSLALDLQKDILDIKDSLFIKDSRGPSYGLEITDYTYFLVDNDEPFATAITLDIFEDIHEFCEPSVDAYRLNDFNFDEDYVNLSYKFRSIKKTEKGRSIAYAVNVFVGYNVSYDYYITPEDEENDVNTNFSKECTIKANFTLYFENTKDKSAKFLGFDDNY